MLERGRAVERDDPAFAEPGGLEDELVEGLWGSEGLLESEGAERRGGKEGGIWREGRGERSVSDCVGAKGERKRRTGREGPEGLELGAVLLAESQDGTAVLEMLFAEPVLTGCKTC